MKQFFKGNITMGEKKKMGGPGLCMSELPKGGNVIWDFMCRGFWSYHS